MFRTFAASLTLAATLLAVPATAAPARVAAAPARARAAAAAPAASPIIKVPLQPTVPASLRMCTARTASGLGYTMLRPGTGARPGKDFYVLVGYIGYLAANGETFDQNARTAFPVDGVIAGFSEGLQMMAKGAVYRFCIPAAQGYGAQAQGGIPANSDLVFQVELFDLRSKAEVEAAQAAAQQKPAEGAAPAQSAAQPAQPSQPAQPATPTGEAKPAH